MKVYEDKYYPARTEKRLAKRKCDLCGKESKSEEWNAQSNWAVNETEIGITVRQKEGNNYPEGGSGYEYEVDLCPDCFKNKLIPWLLSQGANIQRMEWDW